MSITDMNALPDISDNDSQRLQEFVRVTAREVKAVGGASAGTTLEMIGYIRELEHALTNTRAAVAGPRGDTEKQARDLVDAFRYASPPVQSLRFLEWEPLVTAIADALRAVTSSPAPAEKLPLPTDYECIAPSEQVYVINLLRGTCDADKQEAARLHLNLCARCQDLAGGAAPGAQVARECESLIIEGNREEAIKLLRQLRETANPEEIQRQKESWAQLEAALNPTPSDSARRAAEGLTAMFTELSNCYTASKCAAKDREEFLRLQGMAEAYADAARRCQEFPARRRNDGTLVTLAAAPADNDAESLLVPVKENQEHE